MFEIFTEKAITSLFFAQKETQRIGKGYIDTDGILLGILREYEGEGAQILNSLEVTLKDAR